jgi:signal transduction histidine kinase
MAPITAAEGLAGLWLLALQRAVGRASHDVKDALNGVSVNLEVIRSRSARAEVPATAVAKFGDAAAQQLERLTTLIDAVLALARADRAPADVGLTLRRVITVCDASSSSADAKVSLVGDAETGVARTRVPVDVLRLALMAPLLDVVTGVAREPQLSPVTCTMDMDDESVRVLISAGERQPAMPEALADVLRSAGVRWTEGQNLSLAFPRA